jgi:hypothetical protein
MALSRKVVRLILIALVLFGHAAAFVGGYYCGRSEAIADHFEESEWGRGLWDTRGNAPRPD